MNLLIIGNGFDLAHGLKTHYTDFLQWAYENDCMDTYHYYDGNRNPRYFSLRDYWWSTMSEDNRNKYLVICNDDKNPYPRFADYLFSKVDTWIDLENNFARIVEEYRSGYKVDPIFILNYSRNILKHSEDTIFCTSTPIYS